MHGKDIFHHDKRKFILKVFELNRYPTSESMIMLPSKMSQIIKPIFNKSPEIVRQFELYLIGTESYIQDLRYLSSGIPRGSSAQFHYSTKYPGDP